MKETNPFQIIAIQDTGTQQCIHLVKVEPSIQITTRVMTMFCKWDVTVRPGQSWLRNIDSPKNGINDYISMKDNGRVWLSPYTAIKHDRGEDYG